MDGKPGGFVDDEHPRVLVEDALGEPIETIGGRHGYRGRTHPDGRHPDAIAGLQSVARRRAARVHADLPRANEAVNVAARHPFELAEQVVIESLPGRLDVDVLVTDGRCPDRAPGGVFAVDSTAYELSLKNRML